VSNRAARLTERERRVLEEAAQGKTNKEIARALGVSVPTVAFHLGNAFRKLGVSNRKDAVRKYLQFFGRK
jgi:DNA-binding CsgD family transcriptional regulator